MLSSANLQAAANRQQLAMSLSPFQVASAASNIPYIKKTKRKCVHFTVEWMNDRVGAADLQYIYLESWNDEHICTYVMYLMN